MVVGAFMGGLPFWWVAWPALAGLRVRCPRKCHVVARVPPRPETSPPPPTDGARDALDNHDPGGHGSSSPTEGLCEDLGGLKCKHRR